MTIAPDGLELRTVNDADIYLNDEVVASRTRLKRDEIGFSYADPSLTPGESVRDRSVSWSLPITADYPSTVSSERSSRAATPSTQGASCPSSFLPVVTTDGDSVWLRVDAGVVAEPFAAWTRIRANHALRVAGESLWSLTPCDATTVELSRTPTTGSSGRPFPTVRDTRPCGLALFYTRAIAG
jgi:hypothetical protein